MDTLMPVVTALSLLAAVVSTAIALRVTRDERRRRAARVAALAAAAGLHERRPGAAPVEMPEALHEFQPARDAEVPAPAIFGGPVADSGSGWRQRRLLLAAASIGGVIVLGGAATLVVGGGAAAPTTPARPPLELVTLGHQRTEAGLAVSGEVRNPEGSPDVDGVQAEVRVFDAAGILIATQKALVDAPALAPGQSSPFTVPVGAATTAARYRVSFSAAGIMLPHVDRRTNLPAAVTADAR